jgi:hypothetical protein
MTITYSLWSGNSLLSINNTAKNADELLEVMKDLNKLGEGFSYNIMKVDANA